jgi:superfamily II DNA or RNA helicase
MGTYEDFIREKSQFRNGRGFQADSLPKFLFPFQKHLVSWALRRGCAGIFADCGLGKTAMQLAWADQVSRHLDGNVLILTPLAVARQTKLEADKFDIECSANFEGKASRITVTNYDALHKFDKNDFSAVVCDESSILKKFSGATQKQITRFINKMPYRLLCTATAAPNDYVELGTSSEALGELSHSDMLKRFFRQLDDKGQKKELKQQEEAEKLIASDPSYYQKLSYRVAQTIGQWRLKHHAVEHFWRWVASWAMACRSPSDIGFSDDGYKLPKLIERDHCIKSSSVQPGRLFNLPAFGLGEEREERKRTLKDRCNFVTELVDHKRSAVVWCHTNDEGDLLEQMIADGRQIAGRTPEKEKLELYERFASGDLRVLIIKPKIGAWGLNWQHCNHVVTFASHSYEQYYQSVRRCWRFGQKKQVTLDVVATEGEERVLANMRRKAEQANDMFRVLVEQMNAATRVERQNIYTQTPEVPKWLSAIN